MILQAQLFKGLKDTQKNFFLEFDEETTIEVLKQEIVVHFHVPLGFQQIFLDDLAIHQRFPTLPLVGAGLKDQSIVKVEHNHLDQWESFKVKGDLFQNEVQPNNRQIYAKAVADTFKTLMDTGFFQVYPDCTKLAGFHYHGVLNFFVYEKFVAIKKAVERHFNKVYDGFSPEIVCTEIDKVPGDIKGTRSSLVCDVTVSHATTRYRIKTNHDAGRSNQAGAYRLDMVELYCYKLLELIGIGAKITFISNTVSSDRVLYIASEWMDDFTRFPDYRTKIPLIDSINNHQEVQRALVQMHFLGAFFSLDDLNSSNVGIRANSTATIVDFFTADYAKPEDMFFKNNLLKLRGDYEKLLSECKNQQRIDIARESCEDWKLFDKMDEALNVINEEKKNFGRYKLNFERGTASLEKFIGDVKANITKFFNDNK